MSGADVEEQIRLKFGSGIYGKILKGDELMSFDKYCEYTESAGYVF